MRIQISAAGNTMAPCWALLTEMGYAVTVDWEGDAEVWAAESKEIRVLANDPCTLLGLVKLLEIRGQNWQASDEQTAEFLRAFYQGG